MAEGLRLCRPCTRSIWRSQPKSPFQLAPVRVAGWDRSGVTAQWLAFVVRLMEMSLPITRK
jgi:hypothetical protein